MTSSLSKTVGTAFFGSFRALHQAQLEAMGPVLNGHDVLILAGTGSGKTEAALAPLFDRYLSEIRRADGPSLMHVSPTRALANDLLRRLEPPLEQLGLSVGIRHGERNDLCRSKKPALLITTPESLDVMVSSREASIRQVRAVILDEVHLTYNTQRGFQLAVLIKRLEQLTRCELQVVGLSATIASPEDIWTFFRPKRRCVIVHAKESKPMDCLITEVPSDGSIIDLVNQIAAGRSAKILLFANSRRECDSLGAVLRDNTVLRDSVFVHHSSLDKEIRLRTERDFQERRAGICIATSTLELGIDIGDIDLVMLYGPPPDWQSFVQRIGRGNRRSKKSNVACLVSPQQGSVVLAVLVFEALLAQVQNGEFDPEPPAEVYGAVAQQILSVLLERHGAYSRERDLVELFSDWPHLDLKTIEEILAALVQADCIRPHAYQNRIGASDESHRLRDLRLIWGNYPSGSREIKLQYGGRELGTIPSTNLLRLRVGSVLRFAGRHWEVKKIRGRAIEITPSALASGLDIAYAGSRPALCPSAIEQALRLIETGITGIEMSAGLRREVLPTLARFQQYVGWNRLPASSDGRGYHYFTFAGRVTNSVIAHWAGATSFDAGDIVLRSNVPIDFSSLPTEPERLCDIAARVVQRPEDLSLFQMLLPANILRREALNSWLVTPVFRRSLIRLRNATASSVPLQAVSELYS